MNVTLNETEIIPPLNGVTSPLTLSITASGFAVTPDVIQIVYNFPNVAPITIKRTLSTDPRNVVVTNTFSPNAINDLTTQFTVEVVRANSSQSKIYSYFIEFAPKEFDKISYNLIGSRLYGINDKKIFAIEVDQGTFPPNNNIRYVSLYTTNTSLSDV